MMCEILQNNRSNLPPVSFFYLNILFPFICFRILISVMLIKMSSEYTQSV